MGPCYGLDWVSPDSYVETLISNVTVLGGGACGRRLGSEEGRRVGPSPWDLCLFKKGHQRAGLLPVSATRGRREQTTVYKEGRESSPKTDHADTLTLDF